MPYTVEDVALICNKSRKTVERWIKNGLAPIDPSTKPYYFMGDVITTYLRNAKRSRKWDMTGGKYPCFGCKKGVQIKEKSCHVKGNIRHGKCKNCSRNVCRIIGKPYVQIRSP